MRWPNGSTSSAFECGSGSRARRVSRPPTPRLPSSGVDDRNGELVAQSGDLADGASAPRADGRLDVEVRTLLRPVLDAQSLPLRPRAIREPAEVAFPSRAALEDAFRARPPGSEVDVAAGRLERDRGCSPSRDPDPIDVTRILAEVQARAHGAALPSGGGERLRSPAEEAVGLDVADVL